MNTSISSADLHRLINSDNIPVVVEVLPSQYYNSGHIPGAINIPLDEVSAKAASLLQDKSRGVVVYCASASCKNSQEAARILRQAGYLSVYEYTDGKQGWREAGFLLET